MQGRAKAVEDELHELSPRRIAARRAILTIEQEHAASRQAAEVAIRDLNLAFNFSPTGEEISDTEDKRLVRDQEKTQFYWQKRGESRAGKWKSVPLGGDRNAHGESVSSPVWYLASNTSPWDTWAIIDGTRAGLDGRGFLNTVMMRHAEWFGTFTQHRLIVGQCHKKPHNIHAQHWFSVVGPAQPNPGQHDAVVDPLRPTGMLLGRPEMHRRGKSPMRFSFLGKTGCSLAQLRNGGYDICQLTGDPEMERKLDQWIQHRKRNKGIVLDLESEGMLAKIVLAVRQEHPEWEPFFLSARKRHEREKAEEIRRIHEEIAKEEERVDIHDLRARLAAEEQKNAELQAAVRTSAETAGSADDKRKPLSGTKSASQTSPEGSSLNLDARSRVVAMGDALRRTLAGITPTSIDLLFLMQDRTALGGYALSMERWQELGRALEDRSLMRDAELSRQLGAAAEFKDFITPAKEVAAACKTGQRPKMSEFFEMDGNLDPIVMIASIAAKRLGSLTSHPLYITSWAEWGTMASRLLRDEQASRLLPNAKILAPPGPQHERQLREGHPI